MQSHQQLTPNPPAHLSETARNWWAEVLHKYELEPHQLRTLQLAAEALTRCEQARESLEANGLVYIDRFDQPKPRPEAAIARDNSVLFARLCRELRLDIDDFAADDDARLPRDNRRYR